MSSQLLQIVVLAGVALFLVLQLRRVLGTREGFEPTRDKLANGAARSGPDLEVIDGGDGVDADIAAYTEEDSDAAKALAAMKSMEPNFSVGEFVGGARSAYEMIVMAFENGDIETLRQFLSPDVFASFSAAVDDRERQGLHIDANFIGVREVKLLDAQYDAENEEAEIKLRFVGELTSAVRNAAGDIVEGDPNTIKRQKDVWTFARLMGSPDPNWLLVATDQ